MHCEGKACNIAHPAKLANGTYICNWCGRDITKKVLAIRKIRKNKKRQPWVIKPVSKEEIDQLIINHAKNDSQH